MWRNPLLDKTYTAGGTILPYRLLTFGTSDTLLIQATAATDGLLGLSGQVGAASGEPVDITLVGVGEVTLGDTVTRGQRLTADSAGRGIPAVSGNVVGGVALKSGVVGNVVPMLLHAAGDADGAPLYQADVTVATAAVLTLNATPVQLVAAPGAGLIVAPTMFQVFLDYNTTAYDGIAAGEDLTIRYTNASGALLATIETDPFLAATADAMRIVLPVTTAAHLPVANAALVLHLSTGEIATGNSPLKVRTYYRLLPSTL